MNTKTHNETDREQIEMGKLFAEMMNLMADTRKKEDEREKLRAEMLRREDEREKLRAETRKMEAEILKLNAETKWHPFYRAAILWGSAFAAAAAVIKFSNMFLK